MIKRVFHKEKLNSIGTVYEKHILLADLANLTVLPNLFRLIPFSLLSHVVAKYKVFMLKFLYLCCYGVWSQGSLIDI